MLDGSGFAGNDCPSDLNLDGVEEQSILAGQQFTFNLFSSGATLTDLDRFGIPTDDTLRVVLDPDVGVDSPAGATLTEDGEFSWTPTMDQKMLAGQDLP